MNCSVYQVTSQARKTDLRDVSVVHRSVRVGASANMFRAILGRTLQEDSIRYTIDKTLNCN